nr:reverse transcriptase domain-containing protein [Tanacetum cinerariifolium]
MTNRGTAVPSELAHVNTSILFWRTFTSCCLQPIDIVLPNVTQWPDRLLHIVIISPCCLHLPPPWETLTFMDWFKSESSHIKGVPLVLRISAFMHGHGHPELAKKLNDKIPKMVDGMFERVRAFIRGEVAAGSAEMVWSPQWDKGNARSVWFEGQEKVRNRNGPKEGRRNISTYVPYSRRAEESYRGSRSLRKVISPSKIYPSEQSKKCDPGKGRHEDHQHVGKNDELVKRNTMASGHGANVKDTGTSNTTNKEQSWSYIWKRTDVSQGGGRWRQQGEIITICSKRSGHCVTFGSTMSIGCKQQLVNVLRKSMDVFTWASSEGTAVPRFVMEFNSDLYRVDGDDSYENCDKGSFGFVGLVRLDLFVVPFPCLPFLFFGPLPLSAASQPWLSSLFQLR